MISADRIKSVRMAPLILFFSIVNNSSLLTALRRSSLRCSSAAAWKKILQIFSMPSKHRYAPPAINSGVINQGIKKLINNAIGTRIALLSSEPLATAQTTGSSLSGFTPLTWCAFRARSSLSTPAVFWVAVLLINATSSNSAAISSNKAKKLLAAMSLFHFLTLKKGRVKAK